MRFTLIATSLFCLFSQTSFATETDELAPGRLPKASACATTTTATAEKPEFKHCIQRFWQHLQGKTSVCQPQTQIKVPTGEIP